MFICPLAAEGELVKPERCKWPDRTPLVRSLLFRPRGPSSEPRLPQSRGEAPKETSWFP